MKLLIGMIKFNDQMIVIKKLNKIENVYLKSLECHTLLSFNNKLCANTFKHSELHYNVHFMFNFTRLDHEIVD